MWSAGRRRRFFFSQALILNLVLQFEVLINERHSPALLIFTSVSSFNCYQRANSAHAREVSILLHAERKVYSFIYYYLNVKYREKVFSRLLKSRRKKKIVFNYWSDSFMVYSLCIRDNIEILNHYYISLYLCMFDFVLLWFLYSSDSIQLRLLLKVSQKCFKIDFYVKVLIQTLCFHVPISCICLFFPPCFVKYIQNKAT